MHMHEAPETPIAWITYCLVFWTSQGGFGNCYIIISCQADYWLQLIRGLSGGLGDSYLGLGLAVSVSFQTASGGHKQSKGNDGPAADEDGLHGGLHSSALYHISLSLTPKLVSHDIIKIT